MSGTSDISGASNSAPMRVLFLCTHNSSRSQMAEGLLRSRGGDHYAVFSAGTHPRSVHPLAIQVMREIGVDISAEMPKPLTGNMVKAADVVITMGCGDACPIYPGKRYEDWELEDPAGKDLETVRRIRDEIESRVRELISRL